jgi:serine/threonine protein kinase/tetratricopeptide (TPR) repeat protein
MTELPPTDDDQSPDEDAIPPTLDPSNADHDPFATIDSSIRKQPEDVVGDPEQTVDSSIQKRPAAVAGGSHTDDQPSDVSTILPIEDNIATMDGVDVLPPKSPERIAGFRLLGIIGSGGMGKVYLAIQDRPRRHVALKVMKGSAVSEQALRRFEFEAELLARLVHPGIAQIYEAGTFDDGEGAAPYFAMEYVPSPRTITGHCREKKMSTREIVSAMVHVCEAVGFGHGKGIIHRDLKPGNILVGSSGDPKIIDFGVARSTDSDKSITMQTDVHAIVGTLQYMAPEQCTGDVLDLDTSADVYALGITLYQLLTGKLPYEITGQPLTSAIRIVSETVPQRIGSIDKSLAGDLDVIVQKSLAKDRADRYRTASELGDDLRRWLNDESISAAPPTLMVLVRRAIRRNKGLAVAASGMVALLAISIVVGVFALMARNDALQAKAGILQAENDLLEEQSRKRAMVGDLIGFFMRDSFDAIAQLSNSQAARESLVKKSLVYLQQLREEADGDTSIKRVLAEGLQQASINQWSLKSGNRGGVVAAAASAEESVELADEIFAVDKTDTRARYLSLRGRMLLQDAYHFMGRTDDSNRMLAEAAAIVDEIDMETAPAETVREVFGIRMDEAKYAGQSPDMDTNMIAMLAHLDRMVERFPNNRGVQRDATLGWNRIGHAWSRQGENEKALQWFEKSLDVRKGHLRGNEKSNTQRRDVINAQRYIAQQHSQLGDLDRTVSIYRREIIPMTRELRNDSPTDLRALKDLAQYLKESGYYQGLNGGTEASITHLAESRIVWGEAMEASTNAGKRDVVLARHLLETEGLLGSAYLDTGQLDAASATMNRANTLADASVEQWPDNNRIETAANRVKDVRARVLEANAKQRREPDPAHQQGP